MSGRIVGSAVASPVKVQLLDPRSPERVQNMQAKKPSRNRLGFLFCMTDW
jgi:hypothetical protein